MLLRKQLSFQLFFLVCSLFIAHNLLGKEVEEETLPTGNFSVPTVTQIAPLVSFGQLLIGKNALLPQFYGTYSRSHDSYTNILEPSVIYGLSDDFSVTIAVPFTPQSRSGSSHSAGFVDLTLQGEYSYFSQTNPDYTLQGTAVANVQFPTGSSTKNPRTGNGSFSYLSGTTFAFMSSHWYAFISPGVNLTTLHQGTKIGRSYLYQWGFARYIQKFSPPGWIFNLILEFDGTYAKKDKIKGTIDPNSGGNIIMITPSIWLSSDRWILQWGVSLPLLQQLNGHQNKILYSISCGFGVAFQF